MRQPVAIDEVVTGSSRAQGFQHGQSADPGIEHADRTIKEAMEQAHIASVTWQRVSTLESKWRDTLLDFFADFEKDSERFLSYDDGFRSESFRYGDIVQQARAFAAWLRAEGFRTGDKVVLYGENRPEWVIAFWGCLLEGVIAVPVDFRSPATSFGAYARLLKRVWC